MNEQLNPECSITIVHDDVSPMSSSGCLRALLAVSIAGAVLLPLFGAVLHAQPHLVHGLHVDPRAAERNCYLAAACYGVTLVLSVVALWIKKRRADAAQRELDASTSAATSPMLKHLSPRYSTSSPAVSTPGRRALTPREKKIIAAAVRQQSDKRRTRGESASSSGRTLNDDDAAVNDRRASFDAL